MSGHRDDLVALAQSRALRQAVALDRFDDQLVRVIAERQAELGPRLPAGLLALLCLPALVGLLALAAVLLARLVRRRGPFLLGLVLWPLLLGPLLIFGRLGLGARRLGLLGHGRREQTHRG
jgi:hypothetical protein